MLAVAPLLQPLLYATSVHDAGAYIGSVVILTLAALVASWLPAGRAAALNPNKALRDE